MSYDRTPDYTEPFAARETDRTGRESTAVPSGMVSGVATIAIGAGVNPRPPSAVQIVRWLADDLYPAPLTVLVDVKAATGSTALNPYAGQAAAFGQCDGGPASNTELGGVLRFVYGAGNALKVLEADLRSGSYQLPMCTTCTVDAYLYLTGAASMTVATAIVPGRFDAPARLIHSARLTIAAGATATVKRPYGARWVSMHGGAATAIGGGQPSLLLYEVGGKGLSLIQDYLTGTFLGTPGQMIELSGDRTDISVKNNGAASAVVTLRFGLEV